MTTQQSSAGAKNTDLICVGSVLADLIFHTISGIPQVGQLAVADSVDIHPGGCATNTSLISAKLGKRVRLVGRVGSDLWGKQVLSELDRFGILTDSIYETQNVATAITAVLVSTGGERTFIHYPGANTVLSRNDIIQWIISTSRLIHFADTFLLPNLDGLGTQSLLQEAKSQNLITSMDIAWDTKGRWLQLLYPCLPLVDIFFCNLQEARALTSKYMPEEAAALLLELGPTLIVIKMGENGSLIKGCDFTLKIPAFSVDVVDTTGAGDCYVGGFLYGYLEGWDYEKIGIFASAAGAASATAFGATAGICSIEDIQRHANVI